MWKMWLFFHLTTFPFLIFPASLKWQFSSLHKYSGESSATSPSLAVCTSLCIPRIESHLPVGLMDLAEKQTVVNILHKIEWHYWILELIKNATRRWLFTSWVSQSRWWYSCECGVLHFGTMSRCKKSRVHVSTDPTP